MAKSILLQSLVFMTAFGLGAVQDCHAQTQILSTNQPTVEYQYQMYYPRVWGWPGPGWSMGGTLPANTREGVSSFYGRPLPVPLGAGVYMNPFAYSSQLPGAMAFGLSAGQQQPQTGPGIPNPLPSPPPAQPNPQYNPQSNPQLSPAAPPVPLSQNLDGRTARTVNAAKPILSSSEPSIVKSREIEAAGDAHLKNGQWMQAYVCYRNAVIIANDRAEAHSRLGLASAILERYPDAVSEFKKAISIDPTIMQSSESLEAMLGNDSQAARADLLKKVAKWAKGDLRDQDHLFLLGLVLQYDRDTRAEEILMAAMRLPGDNDHIVALMMRPDDSSVKLATETYSPVPPAPSETLQVSPRTAPPEPQAIQESAAPPSEPESNKVPALHHQPIALH